MVQERDYENIKKMPEFRATLKQGKYETIQTFLLTSRAVFNFDFYRFRAGAIEHVASVEAHVILHEEQVHHLDLHANHPGKHR